MPAVVAFAFQATLEFASMLSEFWHWLATQSFAILLGVYLASTACLIALGVLVHVMSRQLATLSRNAERHDALIEKLVRIFDELSATRATVEQSAAEVAPAALPASSDPANSERNVALRVAIEAVIAEMSSDDVGEARRTLSPDEGVAAHKGCEDLSPAGLHLIEPRQNAQTGRAAEVGVLSYPDCR
jgi:hypothetical protein